MSDLGLGRVYASDLNLWLDLVYILKLPSPVPPSPPPPTPAP